MIVKNFLPTYNKYLFAQYFPTFKALVTAGTQIEDALQISTKQDWSSKPLKWQSTTLELQGQISPNKPRQSLTPPKSHTSFTIPHTPQKATQAQTVTYSTKKPHKLHYSPYSTKGHTSPNSHLFHQKATQAQTITYSTKRPHNLHHSLYSTKGPTSPISQTLTHICQRSHKPDFTITHTPQKVIQNPNS